MASASCRVEAKSFSGQRRGESRRVWFVGIGCEQFRERGGFDFLQQRGRGLAALRIHAHVERAVELHGKTARRIVNLHRGNAEVGENQIRAGDFIRRQHLRQPGEIAAVRGENCFAKTQRPQARLGFRQFHRIGVEAEQFSAGQNFGKNFLRVAAVAKRAIHRDFAGLRREHLPEFPRP